MRPSLRLLLTRLLGWLLIAGGGLTITVNVHVRPKGDAVAPVEIAKLGWSKANLADAEELVSTMPEFRIVGDDNQSNERKNVRLWAYSTQLLGGKHIPNVPQETGDCVSFGAAGAINYLQAKQLALDGRFGEFHPIFPPHIYGGSRVTIGKNQIRGAGSVGAWAAEWVRQYGVLRADGDGVPAYSGKLADDWGRKGVPQQFVEASKDFTVETVARVGTAADARDALVNGYPVTIASDFGTKTIKVVDGRRVAVWNGNWPHQMVLIGYDGETGSEPYFYCLNSWGPDAHPEPLQGEPPGGFWIRFKDVDRITRQGDSFAFSDFAGFPAKDLDFSVFGSSLASQSGAGHVNHTVSKEGATMFQGSMILLGLALLCVGVFCATRRGKPKPGWGRLVAGAIALSCLGLGSPPASAAEPAVSFAAWGVAEPEPVSFAAWGVAPEPSERDVRAAWAMPAPTPARPAAAKVLPGQLQPLLGQATTAAHGYWQRVCNPYTGQCQLQWVARPVR